MSCGPGFIAYEFDVTNPEALAWAETRAAEMVTAVTTEARAAIRATIAQGFERGIDAQDLARLVRANIGLTERDALAVMRAQVKWLSDGIDAARATARAERYAAKLTRSRSLTIARTETMRAANEGQRQLWSQARQNGMLDKSAKKVWLTADPCPICAGLEGEIVPLNSNFSIGFDPPAHPNCRCTMGIVS